MLPRILAKVLKCTSTRRGFLAEYSTSNVDSDIESQSSSMGGQSEESNSLDPQKRVIFSGIQPTGVLHLGNYFGAVENWLRLQNEGLYEKMLISVVDLHALTSHRTPEELRDSLRRMVACLLACGLDPKRIVLFQQSKVPQHALLFWILATFSTLPQLNGMPTFKEKSEKYRKGEAPLALFSYPVLQAADILLYKATHVPVGDDQSIHLQYARDMALRFNNRYCYPNSFFPMPQILRSTHPRVRNLRDPTRKMSKSDDNNEGVKGRIDLDDDPDVMANKVKKALTDFISEVTFDPVNRPGVSNLVFLHSSLTGQNPETLAQQARNENLTTHQYKLLVADILLAKFQPIRRKYLELMEEPAYLNEILADNNRLALEMAEKCMDEVKNLIGISF